MLRFFAVWFGLPVLFLTLGGVIAVLLVIQQGKNLAADGNWFETPIGIDTSFYLDIDGVAHFVRIRGRDRDNPVLVDLHGGPGAAQSGYTHRTLRPLTEYFTLVEWDQRGAGRTEPGTPSDATYERLVADTIAIIEEVRTRLSVERIVLVGHSWGSMLGLGVAQERPDLLYGYVGVGQGLAWRATFDETQRLLIDEARRTQNVEAERILTDLPSEWPDARNPRAILDRIATIHAFLGPMGHGMHASHSGAYMRSNLFLDTIVSPDTSLMEAYRMLSASDTILALVGDLHDRDFRTDLNRTYDVPIFIFQGEHDWQTPTSLVRPWFDAIEAPHKHYVAFRDSGHFIIHEEPGRYLIELVTRVRPYAE
ncbi:alpha/beta hydrolase [Cognatiyoonia sp. IB215446]|uniref:alpha/beta fold hydrolase n=1 Tax=Cognatiyoonia sp. IB215446 TaxID=3097355 RepID=UPI002A0FAC14|nr:alpha/beta hydrolase [Cognatiyoonia sp. IB215446]MDX8350645.1 alpha/beta hydrolase [Cognatiyoonia sp. IB215446]